MQKDLIDDLLRLLAKLPGLGPRSARRALCYLMLHKENVFLPLAKTLLQAAEDIRHCQMCYNLTTEPQCAICTDPRRESTLLCIVENVGDLWAIEKAGSFKGKYFLLGGHLSALGGVGPEELHLPHLFNRVQNEGIDEVILATNATLEGQTTAHYIRDLLTGLPITLTQLAHGVPVGGELDYLDEGTLNAAFKARKCAS